MTNHFQASRAVFLLFIICWAAVSDLFALKGKLIDEQGKAISGAAISDKQTVVYSAADGSFALRTEADSIYVSRLGYTSIAFNRNSFSSPIVLTSSQIILPTVWVTAMEYKTLIPSLNADLIHPDTNARVESSADLLLQSTAFSTSDLRLSGERQTISLLGSFSRHALIMLDGVVLNPGGEDFDLSKIPWGQISHVEVTKGSSSVYGGSAAIGGIINLHSKAAEVQSYPALSLSLSTGSFGLYKQSYAFAFSRPRYALNAQYSHQTAKNDFGYDTPAFWNLEPGLKRLHNRKTSDSIYLKSSLLSQKYRLDYSLNAGSFVRQLPGPISFLELYDNAGLTGNYFQQSLRTGFSGSELTTDVLLWQNTDQSTYTNLESTNPTARTHYAQLQHNRGLRAGSSYSPGTLKLSGSTEFSRIYYRFQNYQTGTVVKGSRENSALALSAQNSFFPFYAESKLQAAFRADYSDQKLHPSWRLEQELFLPYAEELKLGAYLGTAFSQPSLFDMYWIGDSETQGNPNLKSESSFGYSVYWELKLSRLKLRFAYYHNRVEDLIQWRQYYLNGLSWRPFNVGKADLVNWEAESRMDLLSFLSLGGILTYTDAVDLSLNSDGSPSPSYNRKLTYTPQQKAALKLNLGNARQGITVSYNYTGKQYSTPDNLIKALPSFATLDAVAFKAVNLPFCTIQLDFKANNLLNKRYEIYAYTPQPGFNWQTNLTLSTGGSIAAERIFQHREKQR